MSHNRLPTPEWLKVFIGDIEKPEIITYDFVLKLGKDALIAKIASVEENNMSLPSRLARKVPDKLEFYEVAVIMLNIFDFRLITLSKQTSDSLLGVYVQSNLDMWDRASELSDPMGIYTTDTNFFYQIISIIEPKFRQRDVNEVLARIEGFAEKVQTTTEKHLYPVNNGIYNQETNTLEDFTPKYVYMTKISVNYN